MASINLIQLTSDKIIVNEKALQQIAKYTQPISVILACGEYRTGKSFLLNSLFGQDCFDVSSTTQACTQGINMIRKPIQKQGKNIWIFDTEGFGSLEKDSKHDAKIFLLSLLISDIFIYNSMGAIDEVSISKMAAMCKQTETMLNIHHKNKSLDNNMKMDNLIKDVKLYWVLRDFSLSLIDSKGNILNSDQYLEQSLQLNSRKSIEERKMILKMFKQRHCFPLVRPCSSEKDLNDLQFKSKYATLRGQFIEQIQQLKNHIKSDIWVKKILGQEVRGAQFCELIKYFVKMINQSNFQINLNVTWQQIQSHQRQQLIQKIQKLFSNKIAHYQKLMPLDSKSLQKLNKQLTLIFEQNVVYMKNNLNQFNIITKQIQNVKSAMMKKIINKNNEEIKYKCKVYLSQIQRQIVDLLLKMDHSINLKELFQINFKKFKLQYFNKFQCYNRQILYEEYNNKLQDLLNKSVKTIQTQIHINKQKQQQIINNKKIIKILQNKQKQMKAENQRIYNQMCKLKQQYDQSLKDIINYVQIIQRMQKVSDNLKSQYQFIQLSQIKLKKQLQNLQLQLQNRQKKYQSQKQQTQLELQKYKKQNVHIKQQLQILNKQIKAINDNSQSKYIQTQQQLKVKVQGVLSVLNNERTHFQQLIMQKSLQQSQLKRQIQQKQIICIKLKQNYLHEIQLQRYQYENALLQLRKQYDNQIVNQRQNHRQLQNKIQMLQIENNKLCEQYQYYIQQNENKNTGMQQIKQRILQLQNTNTQKQQLLRKQINQLKQMNLKVQNEKQQSQIKLKQVQQQYQMLKQKHRVQIKQMTFRLQQSMQNKQNNYQSKCQLLKIQLNADKQIIVKRLQQAAQRITQMHNKQNKLNQKVGKYKQLSNKLNQQVKQVKQQNYQLQTKLRQNQSKNNQLLQQNIKLKQIIQNMTLKNKEQQKQNQKLKRVIEDKEISLQQSQQIIKKKTDKYKELSEKLQSQNMQLRNKLKFSVQSNHKISHNIQNPEYCSANNNQHEQNSLIKKLTQKNEQLVCQNDVLKAKLQNLQIKLQKLKKQSYKQINFHALMKNMKQTEQQQKKCKQNIFSKTFQQTNNNTHGSFNGINIAQKLATKQQMISQLNIQIQQVRRNYQLIAKKTQQLDIIIIEQQRQIEYYHQQEVKYLNQIAQYKQSKQVMRIKFQSKLAQYAMNNQRIRKQLSIIQQKFNALNKEAQFWKIKATQLEEREKIRNSHKNSSYKDKIDNLFNKL